MAYKEIILIKMYQKRRLEFLPLIKRQQNSYEKKNSKEEMKKKNLISRVRAVEGNRFRNFMLINKRNIVGNYEKESKRHRASQVYIYVE